MDFGSPVAQGVNIDPNRTVQTLSGILGLQQQQQQLRSQTAQAQIQEINAQQTQAASQINWKPFLDSGDVDGATKVALAVKPNDPDFATRMGVAIQKSIDVKSAAANLEQQYLTPFKAALAVWAQGNGDIVDLGKQFDAQVASVPKSAQPHVRELANQMLDGLGLPHVMDGAPTTLADQKRAALALSQSALGAEASKPVVGTAIDKQGALVGTTQSPISGALAQAPGGMQPGLAPTQTPAYAGAVSAAQAAGGGGAQVDVQRFAGITNAAATAQTGVALADQVADLAKQVRTGELSQEWANKLTVLKQSDPTITARQMLNKYAAQLKTTATSGAATDSERAQIDAGMPSPESMNPDAVAKAAQYLHGYFRMNQARGVNAMQHVRQTGSVAGLTQKDTDYMQSQDPFVHSFRDMGPTQQKQFLLERYGPGGSKDPQGFADFERRVKSGQ